MLFTRSPTPSLNTLGRPQGFFLLCGGGFHEKLAEAFNLFDLDGNGFLHGVELDMLLDSFYAIAMDVSPTYAVLRVWQRSSACLRQVVCSSLSITTDILQPDAQFDHMVMTLSHDRIKKYLAKVTRQLEQFCSRGATTPHLSPRFGKLVRLL